MDSVVGGRSRRGERAPGWSTNARSLPRTIVIELRSADPGRVKVFSVIDGQQRLTTLQVLLASLRETKPSRAQAVRRLTDVRQGNLIDLRRYASHPCETGPPLAAASLGRGLSCHVRDLLLSMWLRPVGQVASFWRKPRRLRSAGAYPGAATSRSAASQPRGAGPHRSRASSAPARPHRSRLTTFPPLGRGTPTVSGQGAANAQRSRRARAFELRR